MTRQLLLLVILAFVAYGAKAQDPLQDYVLEERGDTLVIANFFDANFATNTLTAVIQAETDAGDVPEGRVYMLRAGSNGTLESRNMSLYLHESNLPEQGRPITIVGEDCGLMVQGDDPGCRPPTISGYEDAQGSGVVMTMAIDDDLTLKNLHFTSAHTQGNSNWGFIGINGNGVTVRFENVLAEHNLWTWVESNGNPGTSLYIKDSYLLNATDQPSRRNGGVYDADVPTDTVWVENTTHLQNQGMIYKFRSYAPSLAMFNHNTFVNQAGQLFLGFGYLTNFAATNNLFVNSNYQPYYPGLDYTESYPEDPDRDPSEYQPHGIINLAPLPVNASGETYVNAVNDSLFAEADRQVLVDLNGVHWNEQLLDIAQDLNDAGVEGDVCASDNCVEGMSSLDWSSQAILANQRTADMFEDDATWPLLTWGTWYQEGSPNFVDGPNMVQALYDWGYDSANSNITASALLPKVRTEGNEAGNEIEGENTNNWIVFDWPVAVNLAYTNETYLDGGYKEYPIGDLNWFPAEKESWLAQRDQEYADIMAALESGNRIGTAIEEVGGEVPGSINLKQNYPNPFSVGAATQIAFSLPQSSQVELDVYDALGRRVATLVSDRLAAGNYTVGWAGAGQDGRALSSGVYFYRLRADDHVETRQMVFVK